MPYAARSEDMVTLNISATYNGNTSYNSRPRRAQAAAAFRHTPCYDAVCFDADAACYDAVAAAFDMPLDYAFATPPLFRCLCCFYTYAMLLSAMLLIAACLRFFATLRYALLMLLRHAAITLYRRCFAPFTPPLMFMLDCIYHAMLMLFRPPYAMTAAAAMMLMSAKHTTP